MQPVDNYDEPAPAPAYPHHGHIGNMALSSSDSSFGDMPASNAPATSDPIPVVRVLSTRGVEYGMMTIALIVGAATLLWLVLSLINGDTNFSDVITPVSALIVCVPVFGLLFLRLKKAELANPGLRLEPSKRRWSQLTQFLAFIACLVNTITFVALILERVSGGSAPSYVKSVINWAVVLVIAGGVLTYYWADEHRASRG